MTINLDNLRKWTAELRNPERLQINGKLAKHTDENDPSSPVGYCCLGVGCEVAGIPAQEFQEDDEVWIMYDSADEFPPIEFADFLGLDTDNHEVNPILDAPDNLRWRGGESMRGSLTAYNDGVRLTFPQIADLIDYFGVTL